MSEDTGNFDEYYEKPFSSEHEIVLTSESIGNANCSKLHILMPVWDRSVRVISRHITQITKREIAAPIGGIVRHDAIRGARLECIGVWSA
jgi:hypothetical protein